MLAPKFIDGERSATIEALDPFLHQYESEYHYLFKRVYEEAQKPIGQGLEMYYGIPNMMDVLALIQGVDAAHYLSMVNLVAPKATNG